MKLVYFAWVRERIGRTGEEIEIPAQITTVGEFLTWLRSRGEEYERALEHQKFIRVALDRRHAPHDAALGDASEIALFPPMTGG